MYNSNIHHQTHIKIDLYIHTYIYIYKYIEREGQKVVYIQYIYTPTIGNCTSLYIIYSILYMSQEYCNKERENNINIYNNDDDDDNDRIKYGRSALSYKRQTDRHHALILKRREREYNV